MKIAALTALTLALSGTASADTFSDDCKKLREGNNKIGPAAMVAAFDERGSNGAFFRTVESFGKRDLADMEGLKAELSDTGRVDAHSGEDVDCSKVKDALTPLMDDYKKVLDKFDAAKKYCAPKFEESDIKNIVEGKCGKDIKAAHDERDKFWNGPVKAYARAESTSAAACRANYHARSGFYNVQKDTFQRKVNSTMTLAQKFKLEEVAKVIEKAKKDKYQKLQGQLKSQVNAIVPQLTAVENAFKNMSGTNANKATSKKYFEARINFILASDRLQKLHERACVVVRVTSEDTNGGQGGGPGGFVDPSVNY